MSAELAVLTWNRPILWMAGKVPVTLNVLASVAVAAVRVCAYVAKARPQPPVVSSPVREVDAADAAPASSVSAMYRYGAAPGRMPKLDVAPGVVPALPSPFFQPSMVRAVVVLEMMTPQTGAFVVSSATTIMPM